MRKQSGFYSLALVGLFVFSILSFADEKAPARTQHERQTQKQKFLDLSRPVDTSKRMVGSILFKAIEPGQTWPFFVVTGEGGKTKEYKIETCDETCKAEIDKCKGGERCEIRAEVSEGEAPFIVARTLKVLPKKLEDPDFDKNFAFAEVEPGEFTMGSPSAEKDRESDEIAHRVAITKGFEIGKTEVTQGMWKKVMGSLPKGISKQDDNLPITYVSWNEVQDFITRLNGIRKGDGYTYRLPTEAEWEYAARGAQKVSPEARQNAYSFGNTDTGIDDYVRSWNNSKGGAQQVGSRRANPLGLSDMHGNVCEWTMDKYTSDASKVQIDPKYGHPVNLTEGSYRVIRGGSWNGDPQHLRSAYRNFNTPDYSFVNFGFRLVRTPE